MSEEEQATLLRKLAREADIEAYALFLPKYEQTARRLGQRNDDPKLSRETVGSRQWSRWLAAKAAPQPYARLILEELFGQPVELLMAPVGTRQVEPASSLSVVQHPHITEEDLLMTAHDAASHAGDAASLSLTPEAIQLLRTQLRGLARGYHQKPAAEIFIKARTIRDTIERRMALTHRPTQSSELYLLAGQACALLASAAFDLGSQEAAETLTIAALAYVRPIDHAPLAAWCGGNLALLAYWDGRPSEALEHVKAAQGLATSGTARLRLHSVAARTYAHLGMPDRVQYELEAAQQVDHDIHDDHHDDMGGEFGFSMERAAMSAGSSWLLVSDGAKAVQASSQALELVRARPDAQRSVKVEMEATADLALAQLLNGDFEAAVTTLGPVFELPPEQRVDGLLSRLKGVRTQLTVPALQRRHEASELGHYIEGFSRDSAKSAMPGVPRSAIGN
ncbi:DNA-binding protein [Streptomyces sp. NPDC059928]|uniref:DNA-binding protein n=1 Tax=unclassified Streptomyces TaxID=2593676 RepID=UPI00364C40A6